MARIRTIKPEFPHSESMGRVSRDARLLFVQLWTLADDEGRLRGNSRILASLLYPYDDDAKDLMDSWLAELEQQACIVRYLIDGSTYLQIVKWSDHQKIDKPTRSKLPPFDESSRILASPREPSRMGGSPTREASSGDLDQDLDQDLERNGSGPCDAHARAAVRIRPDDDHECMDRIQATFPTGPNPTNWLLAIRNARRIVDEGRATWPFLVDTTKRYAAFVAAGGVSEPRYVYAGHNFFAPDGELWKQPWDPPPTKADVRLAGNIDAVAQAKRELFGADA